MRLTRVHCAAPLSADTELALPEGPSAHVRRVLRLRAGDSLRVFDGAGAEFRAVIASVAGGTVRVRLAEPIAAGPDSPLEMTLVQGVSRGERMDVTLQKATELGVRRIAPVLTARSVVRLDARQAQAKLRHWQAIVVAACEQCGRSCLPEVRAPLALAAHLSSPPAARLRLVLDPDAGEQLAALTSPVAGVELLVGPEGGLDEAELAAAVEAGFRRVRLGPRILRTETAAIAALAILQSRWGDLA